MLRQAFHANSNAQTSIAILYHIGRATEGKKKRNENLATR